MKKMRKVLLYVSTFFIVVLGDQLTKIIVDHNLQLWGTYKIIDDFFYFTYSQNRGGAWGIFEGRMGLFYLSAVLATIGIYYFYKDTQPYQKLTRFGLVLVFSGMVGNLIDRVFFGYVRDFIDFVIFGYDFPIFNVADIAITVGMGLIILDVAIEEYKVWKMSKLM